MDVGAALLRPQLQKRVYTRQSAHPLIATELFCPLRPVKSTSRPQKFDVTHAPAVPSQQKPRFLLAEKDPGSARPVPRQIKKVDVTHVLGPGRSLQEAFEGCAELFHGLVAFRLVDR